MILIPFADHCQANECYEGAEYAYLAHFVISEFSSNLGLLTDFCLSKTGIFASVLFLKASSGGLVDSRGLASCFSTLSNLVVAHGAVPTLLVELGPSIVSIDTASLDAYQECPQAMHSS